MIALDTNVIVRLLVDDDPRQAKEAERLIRDARERGIDCFISDPVLCEIEWVLESCYRASRADILAAMRDLLGQEGFLFEDRQVIRRSIEAYQGSKADFSDHLIGAKAQARGATVTYTFDRDLRHAEGFFWLG